MQLARQVLPVPQDQRVQKGTKVIKETQEPPVHKERKDRQGLQEQPGPPVPKEIKVIREIQVQQGPKAQQDPKAYLVQREPLVQPVLPDQQGPKVIKVIQDLRVPQELLGLRVLQDQQGQKETKVIPGPLDLRVPPGLWVPKEIKEIRVPLGHRDPQAQPVHTMPVQAFL